MEENFEAITEVNQRPTFSNAQRILFWLVFILVCIALSYAIYVSNLVNWFPLLVVVLIICMYSFSSIHQNKFSHPYRYLIPLFVALSISFTVITVTIGMHGNLFVSYDNDANNFSPSSYQPLEVKEILKLPIQQLDYHEVPKPLTIDFTNLKDTARTSNIIIIDKTLSVVSADPTIKELILQDIKREFSLDYRVNGEYNVTELLPPFFLSGLNKNERYSSAKDDVGIYYYTGVKGDYNGSLDIITDNLSANFQEFMYEYFEANKNYKQGPNSKTKSGQKTSLNDMVNSLKAILENQKFDGKKINVSIVSDFINSKPNDTIPDISSAHRINRLNLYVLNGRDGQGGNLDNVHNTIMEMVANFSILHNQTIINFKNVNFNNSNETKKLIAELKTSNMQVFDDRGIKNVPVYYPYKDFLTNQEAVARISVKDTALNSDESEFMFSIKNVDNNTTSFPIIYRINNGVSLITHFNELKSIKLNATDVLSLYFPYTQPYKDDRLFAEFISTSSNKVSMQSLTVKPLLSKAMSFTLLGVYTIFVVALCLVLILPNIYVYYMISHELIHCQKGHSIGLTLPLAVGSVSLFYFGGVMCNHGHWALLFLSLAMLLFATIPALISSYKKHVEERNELVLQHTFHLFGSIGPDVVYIFLWRRS